LLISRTLSLQSLLLLLVLLQQAVDLLHLFILVLEGQSGLDLAVEVVLTPEHGALVDEEAGGESRWRDRYPMSQGSQSSLLS